MRSEALQQLDQHFDVFERLYADDQIGDLEDEADEIGGEAQLEALSKLFDDHLRLTEAERRSGLVVLTSKKDKPLVLDDLSSDDVKLLKERTLALAVRQEERRRARVEAGRDEPLPRREVREEPEEKWDAESYTSLFSTTEHHPATVDAPRRNRRRDRANNEQSDAPPPGASTEEIVRFRLNKKGMPIAGLLPHTNKRDADDDESDDEAAAAAKAEAAAMHTRPKGESKEEKAARKAAVKAARAEVRQRKKLSRVAQREKQRTQTRAKALSGPQKALQL